MAYGNGRSPGVVQELASTTKPGVKVMVSVPGLAFASLSACSNVPAPPHSDVLVTVKVAACAGAANDPATTMAVAARATAPLTERRRPMASSWE